MRHPPPAALPRGPADRPRAGRPGGPPGRLRALPARARAARGGGGGGGGGPGAGGRGPRGGEAEPGMNRTIGLPADDETEEEVDDEAWLAFLDPPGTDRPD